MAEFEKIAEQEEILQINNKNVIVSASAGSGKTTLMIRKIVNLINNNNVKVKDLLVLTYTKAAAREMKQKLITAMQKETRQDILEQIDDVNMSDISTFDSFCQKLVKKYFYVLDIDPSFSTLSASEQTVLENKALENALDSYKTTNPDEYYKLLTIFASNRTDSKIKSIILKIYDFLSSVLDNNKWQQTALNMLQNQKGELHIGIVKKYFLDTINYCTNGLNKVLNICNNCQFLEYLAFINQLTSNLACFNENQSLENLINLCVQYKNITLCRKLDADENGVREQIDYYKKHAKKYIDEMSEFVSGEVFKNSIQEVSCISNLLLNITNNFMFEYAKIKKRKNVYDYNDIERLVIKLYQNESVRQTIKNSYKYIFLDEFQDANEIQEEIINKINNNNVFYVGDLKQAIYGFRKSDPKIFMRVESQFASEKNSEAKTLNSNFRSSKNILNFVNKIFSVLMTEKTAKHNYKQNSLMVPKAKYVDDESADVELNIISLTDKKDLIKPNTQSAYSVTSQNANTKNKAATIEARFIAKKIHSLIGTEIYDVSQSQFRKIGYNDITILLKSRGSYLNELVQQLSLLNVPVTVNTNVPIEETMDAGILIDLIKVSFNYKNDISLSAVMMSELFNFSADEMSKIRQQSKGSFASCVKLYADMQSDSTSKKITFMFNMLNQFAINAKYKGLNYALSDAVVKTDYLFKLRFSSNFKPREENILAFIASFTNSVYNYDAQKYLSFLSAAVRDQKITALSESKDVVNITTMHSSKGLEYPVVILANLTENFNQTGADKAEVELSQDLGVGVKYYDIKTRTKYPSVIEKAIKITNYKEQQSERIRLLYVALTRAKNKLIMCATTNSIVFSQIKNDVDVIFSNNYFSLIVGSLDEIALQKINSGEMSTSMYNNKKFVLNVIDEENTETLTENLSAAVFMQNEPEGQVNELSEYIFKPYFNKNATLIAQKNSVTALAAADEYSSSNLIPEKLMVSEHLNGLSKNVLGSLYHKVLELADFEKEFGSEIQRILQIIKSSNMFEAEYVSKLNIKLLEKNFKLLEVYTKNKKQLKEQKFMMYVPYNEILNSKVPDNVLVQGVCDLIVINNSNMVTIIDYKFSNLCDADLIKKYQRQIDLYKKAVSLALNKTHINCYILNIKTAKLIEC